VHASLGHTDKKHNHPVWSVQMRAVARAAAKANRKNVNEDDVAATDPVVATKFDAFLTFTWSYVSPIVLAVLLLIPCLLHPEAEKNTGFLIVLPHVFVLLFIPYIAFLIALTLNALVRRGIPNLVRNAIVAFINQTWRNFVEVLQYTGVRVVMTLFGLIIIVLASEWLYYHFDIFNIISSIKTFIVDMVHAFFNFHRLVEIIYDWTHGILGFAIQYLHWIMDGLRYVVREHMWLGLGLLAGMITLFVIAISVFKECNKPANVVAATENQPPHDHED